MSNETGTETVVNFDPSRGLVSSIVSHAFTYQDEVDVQTLADVVMATLIMCELFDVDRDNLQHMLDVGQPNATKAADHFLAQIMPQKGQNND